jgi:glycosyltransferase involved in cell wall biosynthesis
MKVKVSVLVAAHNEELAIGHCLQSLRSQAGRARHEVIVIDNASSDRTSEIATQYADAVLRCEVRGRLHALNLGLHSARGSIVAFADADTIYPKDWVEQLSNAFDHYPSSKLVFGPSTQGIRNEKLLRGVLVAYGFWVKWSLALGAAPSVGFNMALTREAAEAIMPEMTPFAFHDWAIGTEVLLRWGRGATVYAKHILVPKCMRRYIASGWIRTSAIASVEWWRLASGRGMRLLERDYHSIAYARRDSRPA